MNATLVVHFLASRCICIFKQKKTIPSGDDVCFDMKIKFSENVLAGSISLYH